MPALDVSNLLNDPDFCTSIQLYRAVTSVDSHGRRVDNAAPPVTVVAVVVPKGLNLSRQAEGERITGGVTVYSKTRLAPGTQTTPPDEIVYQGRRYIVSSAGDWSAFGFYSAECDLRDVVPRT